MQRGSQKIREWCDGAIIVPVLTITKIEDAIPVAEALVAGGIQVIEITLRSKCALEAIASVRHALDPQKVKVAAGTVRTSADVFAAKEHNADFAISPGTTLQLLDSAFDAMLPILPGVSTASEVMQWNEYGLDFFQFFPAEQSGGVTKLKTFYTPLPDIAFCPTGGINPTTARSYLDLPNVHCVGGSWLVNNQHYEKQSWDEITQLAQKAMSL